MFEMFTQPREEEKNEHGLSLNETLSCVRFDILNVLHTYRN